MDTWQGKSASRSVRFVLVRLTHSNFNLFEREFVFASFSDLATRNVDVRKGRSNGDDVFSR